MGGSTEDQGLGGVQRVKRDVLKVKEKVILNVSGERNSCQLSYKCCKIKVLKLFFYVFKVISYYRIVKTYQCPNHMTLRAV